MQENQKAGGGRDIGLQLATSTKMRVAFAGYLMDK
jgi:hypothetical protein